MFINSGSEVDMMPEYRKPGWFVKNVLNRGMAAAVRLGLSPSGAQLLFVKGRKSGELRSTPVNPLTVDGVRYLVAPRGETQWVRNIRANPEARLKLGRKTVNITVAEVADSEKAPLLKAYLDRWAGVTASHFGVPKEYTDADIERIIPRSPVFRVV